MPSIRRAPTPAQFAEAWVDAARRALAPIAVRGRVALERARGVNLFGDNVVRFLEARGQRTVSLERFLDAGRAYAEREAARVAGPGGRVSLVEARRMAADLVDDFLALRGAARDPAPAVTDLRGTWWIDLDTGVQSDRGDIWWEQVDDTTRYLTPGEGVRMNRLGAVDFDSVTLEDLQGLRYSSRKINGSDDDRNRLPAGTVVAVETDEGRYSKLLVEDYSYDLRIRFVTFGEDGRPLDIHPTLVRPHVEPPAPVEPPGPVEPPPQAIEHPVAPLRPRNLPRGVAAPLEAAAAATLGDARWNAQRFTISPARLARIERDPALVGALASDLCIGPDHAWIGPSWDTEPTTSDRAAIALAERIPGWEDSDEARRAAITDGIQAVVERLFPESFAGHGDVRFRVASWGDEDGTVNFAGLVAWNLATGEARALAADKIW